MTHALLSLESRLHFAIQTVFPGLGTVELTGAGALYVSGELGDQQISVRRASSAAGVGELLLQNPAIYDDGYQTSLISAYFADRSLALTHQPIG